MTVARKLATYDDLLALPEHVIGQIIDGELVVHPRPAAPHTLAASSLGGELSSTFGRKRGAGPGGWLILIEPEIHLNRDVIVPDMAGWRRERADELPRDAAFFTLPPDWACEVLSPTTARIDRGRKRAIYAEHGVTHLWHVDPDARLIEVFRLESGRYSLISTAEGEEKARLEPFEVTELDLLNIWDP